MNQRFELIDLKSMNEKIHKNFDFLDLLLNIDFVVIRPLIPVLEQYYVKSIRSYQIIFLSPKCIKNFNHLSIISPIN